MALRRISFLAVLILLHCSIASANRLHGRFRRYGDTAAFDGVRAGRGRPTLKFDHLVDNAPQSQAANVACANTAPRKVQAPKKNIWWGLTDDEHHDVSKFLKDHNHARAYDITLMTPNKTDTLPYLDKNKEEPLRYAQATIYHQSNGTAYMQYILVGPLPVEDGKTTLSNLSYPFTKKSNGRNRDLFIKESALYSHWINKMGKAVADITMDLWNATAVGNKNDTLFINGIDPLWQDDGIFTWQSFASAPKSFFDIATLTPLGLYFQMNITSDDWRDWKLMGWLYNDEFFPTTKEFRKAYFSKKLPRLPAVDFQGAWPTTDRRGPKPPLDHFYPPTLEAPSGSRFFIDEDEDYVKWMDFEFYITFPFDTGLKLFDIKYKGKRIIYELGMQEAMAHYAGNDPVQSSTAYLDSYYGFGGGFGSFALVSGYDCPSYATYFADHTYHSKSHKKGGQICLFEMDAGHPISRHAAFNYVTATKNIFLTLRSISTIGNYDYMFDYTFYMDGSMGVEVRASGYIQAAYFAKNEEYGYKIHNALSGSMHDHVLNFKADFDIDGLENTMQLVRNVPVSQVYPWSAGKPRNTMKLQRQFISSENESKLYWGHNADTQHIITNQGKKNKWGESPGFRIYPANTAIHLAVKNSSNLKKAAEWSTHDLFVTKQKDTEPRSAHPNNNQDVNDPLVNFDEFFDGESLEQTDLVTWFNLGMHHIPSTGDLPNTVFTTAHSGVRFQPINYLPDSPTVNTVNMVRLNVGSNKRPSTVLFGQNQGMCSLDYASQTFFGKG